MSERPHAGLHARLFAGIDGISCPAERNFFAALGATLGSKVNKVELAKMMPLRSGLAGTKGAGKDSCWHPCAKGVGWFIRNWRSPQQPPITSNQGADGNDTPTVNYYSDGIIYRT